jgi:outer membrane protein assembly factor BamB
MLRGAVSLAGALLKTAAALLVIGVTGYLLLTHVFGMRVERSGTGFMPIFSFTNPEQHMAALERERAEQPPVPLPEVVEEPKEPAILEAAEQEAEVAPVPKPAPKAVSAPWPEFRGRNRDGVIEGVKIRTEWPLEEVWRTNVGGGYASMSVGEGMLFTIEQRREQEVVAAYQLETGLEAWTNAWDAYFEESLGGPGPRATPTYAGGRIYAQGAEGELRCLRAANGELLWRTNILEDAGTRNARWAMAGAPLVLDGRVIVHPGGDGGKSVSAYDAGSGKLLWQSASDRAGYASPQTATLAGKEQVLIFSATRLFAIDPADGHELWGQEWSSSNAIHCAQPIQVSDNQVWFSSGYGHGSALVEISRVGGGFQAEKLWETNTMKNKFNPAVIHEGNVYGLDDGIMASISLKTGERNWKGGRYGFGQVLLADGHVIVLTEKGDLVLVKATPESHREVASFHVLDGKTWNVPAYADGLLLVRNQTEMAAYRLAQ